MSLTQAIKTEALRLGFQLVGITTPDPPPHFGVYEYWLAAGREGEMAYLATERARQRRADPRQILPECRSILVLGMRYYSPEAGPGDETHRSAQDDTSFDSGPEDVILSERSLRAKDLAPQSKGETHPSAQDNSPLPLGRVASYAWGQDYHDVLPERLQALVEFIEERAGGPVPNRWYTDTGPILERDLAQRAGLGWIGKNTCLIQPQMGSYFLLAEILLGIDLEPNQPVVTDHCGSCTRCLEACPTACILPDRTLDARRCISYLTIELKGSIPQELRPQIGDWVFGCDICQQVCPWNQRFAEPKGEPAFAPRPGVPRPDLVRELGLTPEAFNRKFKGSPVKRAKRRGYLRNVAVALGNARNPAAIPALAHSLARDPEPLVRAHVAWALGRIGGEPARQALLEAAGQETDELAATEIQNALHHLGSGSPAGSGRP